MSQKLEKLKFDLVKFTKLGKLEVGYFGEQITLKVKVAKIELKKVKVGQKLAKTPQLSITLKVGLTLFCLWVYRCTGLQVYRSTGLQVYRSTGLQVYRSI